MIWARRSLSWRHEALSPLACLSLFFPKHLLLATVGTGYQNKWSGLIEAMQSYPSSRIIKLPEIQEKVGYKKPFGWQNTRKLQICSSFSFFSQCFLPQGSPQASVASALQGQPIAESRRVPGDFTTQLVQKPKFCHYQVVACNKIP